MLDERFFINVIVKPLFVFLIYFGLYSRTFGFFGYSGGMLSVYISFSLFIFSLLHFFFYNKELVLTQFTWIICLFFFFSGVTPLLSAFIFNAPPTLVLRFSIETAVTFFMFFSVYYFVREGIISPKFFLYSIAILGFLVSVQLLVNIFDMVRVRRVRTLSGLNYMGNSFAMAVFSWIVIMYYANINKERSLIKWINYFCFIFTVLSLLLTGTRGGLVALVFGVILFQAFGIKSKKFNKYVFISLIGIFFSILLIAINVDLSLLFSRYSYADISRMAGIRFEIFYLSLFDYSITELVFGRPDLYLFGDSGVERAINSHNIFLGYIRYNGIFSFILISLILFFIISKYLIIYKLHKNNERFRVIESTILVLISIVMIYALLSGGRITRSFAFYIVLGFAVGYFEIFRNLNSYEDYKKLIF